MIFVCRDEISPCTVGTDLILRLHMEIKFHPGTVFRLEFV